MESRVLSRATAFSSSLPNVKPIGAVADGGNLIWGRQLHPALYSPALRKDTPLRPCLAAASSPTGGCDSAGEAKVVPVGFFNWYPVLVAGFFFFMWYLLNVIFNILNKKNEESSGRGEKSSW